MASTSSGNRKWPQSCGILPTYSFTRSFSSSAVRKDTCAEESGWRTNAEPGFNRETQKGDLPSQPRMHREWRRQHLHSALCECRQVALARTASICTGCCPHKEMFWKSWARRVPRLLPLLQSYQRCSAQQVYEYVVVVCLRAGCTLLKQPLPSTNRRCRVLSVVRVLEIQAPYAYLI